MKVVVKYTDGNWDSFLNVTEYADAEHYILLLVDSGKRRIMLPYRNIYAVELFMNEDF